MTEALRIGPTLQADSHPVVCSEGLPQATSSPSVLRATQQRETRLGSSVHCVSSVGSKSWPDLFLEMAPFLHGFLGEGVGLSKGSHRPEAGRQSYGCLRNESGFSFSLPPLSAGRATQCSWDVEESLCRWPFLPLRCKDDIRGIRAEQTMEQFFYRDTRLSVHRGVSPVSLSSLSSAG